MRSVLSKIAVAASLAAATFTVSNTALAGGDVYKPYLWSGFYAGVHAGFGDASYDGVFDSGEPGDNNVAFADELDLDGVVAGVHVGYNWQRNNLVLGIELDATATGMSDVVSDANAANEDFIEGDIDFMASLRGRVGFASDTLLVYATAGIAYADASFTAINEGGAAAGDVGTVKFDDIGYVVGGGVEKSYGGMRFRLEGLYYGFDETIDTSDLNNDSDDGDFAKLEDIWTVRFGVSVPLSE